MPTTSAPDSKLTQGPASVPAVGVPGPSKAKRVGIREIARQAGVSVATVSMVINDNPKITEATARKVRRVMEKTGYQPNRIAQSLSSQYTRILAVLIPTLRHVMADPYFGEVISGICDRAAKRGHKVMVEQARPQFIKDQKHLELFERRFVDGVLAVGVSEQHTFLKDFADRGYPLVVVNTHFPEWGLNHVVCDYTAGAEQVMTYLLQLGHRKIGLVHGSLDVATARQVIDVYQAHTDAAGLGLDASWLVDGQFTEEHGYEAARELLGRHPDTTAVFAGNDKMALGVMHYLTEAGKRVPHDVSVIGCDDIQSLAYVNPALSTVHLPLYEVGTTACERLIEVVRGKRKRIAETLPTHLVVRGSTAMVNQPAPT